MIDNGSLAVVCGDITAALNRRFELISSLGQQFEEARIFSPQADPKYLEQLAGVGYEAVVISNNKQSRNIFADVPYIMNLFRKLRAFGPNDVFVFHVKQIIYTGLICRFLGVNYHVLFAGLGFLFRNSDSFSDRCVRKTASLLLRSALSDAKTIFFQNPDDLRTFLDLKIITKEQPAVVVRGSGVSLSRFRYVERTGQKPVTFLCVARILRDKGLFEFYEAARELKSKWGDAVHCQLLGPFDRNPNAIDRSTIQKWADQGVIDYLGEAEDIRPFLDAASVFVLPSYYMEGTPKTILESLAKGLPVVTTISRGCKETVEDGVNGYLIEPRNPGALFEAMERYLKTPTLAKSHGKCSRLIAEHHYDVEKVNRTMLEAMGLNDSPIHGDALPEGAYLERVS